LASSKRILKIFNRVGGNFKSKKVKVLNLKEMKVVEGGRFLGWGWKEYGQLETVSASWCESGYAIQRNYVYTIFGLETSITKDSGPVCLR
jgi:hypothetical protein